MYTPVVETVALEDTMEDMVVDEKTDA